MTLLAPDRLAAAERLGLELVHAWGSWGPTMTPDAARTAFISDRGGSPEVWVQDVASDGEPPAAHCIRFTDDPVLSVSWSADSAWLACLVATDGGVRTQVWVVRPDGSDARRIAGSRDAHAELGPWTRSGHHVVVTVPSAEPEQPTRSFLVDPVSGERRPLVDGDLISVLDLSVEERLVVVRDGQRGHQYCVVVDRLTNENHALLPDSGTGSTDVALLRPPPSTTTRARSWRTSPPTSTSRGGSSSPCRWGPTAGAAASGGSPPATTPSSRASTPTTPAACSCSSGTSPPRARSSSSTPRRRARPGLRPAGSRRHDSGPLARRRERGPRRRGAGAAPGAVAHGHRHP
ncbi:hypothetical protein Q0F99_04135 [Rathayibacter oskolensis]|uniref:TolB family protein n=1 Tax=Rathayibacter oskolensis TaxID=1891671 RepID=UPI00265FA7F0|nr:hypothetical protein [Rathayibacter oskolensis]WKK73440.1 hypothetical protein Q0F99_04135 [Rathayibacter oskolensis]